MKTDELVEYVARSYNITSEVLKSKSKLTYVAEPRFVVYYLMRTVIKLKIREIAEYFSVNEAGVFRALNSIKKKLQDSDFKEHFDLLKQNMNANNPISSVTFKRDLEEFKKNCRVDGKCLVAKYMKIVDTSFGRKYGVTTANQLYYLLSNGKYPASARNSSRGKQTCSTENCVIHWDMKEGDDYMINMLPVEENENDWVSPEERLIHAIIQSAIEEKDTRYLQSSLFYEDLALLGVTNTKKILQNLPEWAIM